MFLFVCSIECAVLSKQSSYRIDSTMGILAPIQVLSQVPGIQDTLAKVDDHEDDFHS